MGDRRLPMPNLGLVLLSLAAATLLMYACTSGEDHLRAIPVAPAEARELTTDEMPFDPAVVAEGFKASLDASTVEIRVYAFPSDIPFSQIAAYYRNQLPGQWVEQSSEALETARAQDRDATIWANDPSHEILSVQYVASSDLDGNILIVIYAQRD